MVTTNTAPNTPAVPNALPEVFSFEGHTMTTSLKVAEVFGKQHCDVIRAVESLQVPDEWHKREFALMSHEVRIGNGARRLERAFRMTRNGFTILAMGFTGKKAMAFKLAYIEAFDAMEDELRARGATFLRQRYSYPLHLLKEADGLRWPLAFPVDRSYAASYVGRLLADLDKDGHDVNACKAEYMAALEALRRLQCFYGKIKDDVEFNGKHDCLLNYRLCATA